MNNNTTKQIDATTQRSTSNLVSTQSARERSVREISTQVDKHKANKHRCTKWLKLRTNRYHCKIRYTSAVTLFQIHGCKARDIHDSTFVDKQINYYKQEAVHNNYGERIHHRQWKVVKQTNKQTKTETNKQNFSLLQSNTVIFILYKKNDHIASLTWSFVVQPVCCSLQTFLDTVIQSFTLRK